MSINDQPSASSLPAIEIMLVSHTNVGKTSLVRTLLGKDVGEVCDAPDVTKAVAAYDLVVDEHHGALRLWDTPGFGDSFRLAKRLQQKHGWIAWIIREIWDRYLNRRLWRSQRVALDLRQRADVILYLVNVLERPVDAIFVKPEMAVLAWIDKPVLAILNQSGTQTTDEQRGSQITEWRNALASYTVVRNTLLLDSFTRCWLQELVLFDEIGHVLPEQTHHVYLTLANVVQAGHQERFDNSISAIAEYLLRIAHDKVEIKSSWFGPLKDAWDLIRNKIPWGNTTEMDPHELAMESLAQRFMDETKAVTDKLIVINRLTGVSAGEIVKMAGEKFSIDGPVDESTSALAGGVISGALTGLGADLLAGGLTLGTGALVGAVLGVAGAAALAKGYNIYSSKGNKVVGWSPESLTEAFQKTVMLYLAIAHFGRGQGEWRSNEVPEHWSKMVDDAINRYRERLWQLWARTATDGVVEQTRHESEAVLRYVLVEVLQRLYPESRGYLSSAETR